ncbi:MAG: zeta toxin family protein [Mycoplasmoidaceae bacterium]|nr:zeta toxin family protein [Mycoplasmoidaceae bacterium]
MKNKLIIVAGCSGSGKSTISKKIKASFNKKDAQIICMDRFYKADKSLMPIVNSTGNPNFDHPDAFD